MLALAGCSARRAPLALEPAPWRDGERGVHDVYGADAKLRSSIAYRIEHTRGGGWRLAYEETAGGARTKDGGVEMTARLRPTRSWVVAGGRRTEAVFAPGRVRFVGPGARRVSIARSADAVDREQLKVVLRALPFAAGRDVPLTFVDPGSGSATAMVARVVEVTTVVVPAGRFAAWRVNLDTGMGGERFFWFAKSEPHAFLRYRWPGVSEIVLRSFQPAASAPSVGPDEASATTPGLDPSAPIPIHWGLVITQVTVSLPLMLLLPILVAVRATRKLAVPFRVVLIGAAGFVASQVVHLPLNALIEGSLARLPAVGQWLVAGASAGVCEECARWLAMRFALKRPREQGWAAGIAYGAGHGGVEAMIMGMLLLVSVLNSVLGGTVTDLAVRAALHGAAEEAAHLPWSWGALAGIERVGALASHVGLSVLVMRAVTRRRVGWLLAAIALHTLLDAAIGLKSRVGTVGLEVIVIVFGALCLGLAFRLREPAPQSA